MAAVHPFTESSQTLSGSSQPEATARHLPQAPRVRSTLLLRIALMNLLSFGLLGAAWHQGYVAMVIEADKTYLSIIIFLVFLVGLALVLVRAKQIGQELTGFARPGNPGPANLGHPVTGRSIGALRLHLSHRIAAVRHIANVLVLLGLIGTVLGFIIALSGVNPDTAQDVEGIGPMVSTLIQGMSTALYTTLIGSILNVWLTANYQLLSTGTVQLMSLWMEQLETQERSQQEQPDA